MSNQYLKSYQVVLRTVGPVFVGSGREIGKKEYVFLNRRQVGIPDIQGLYGYMARRRKQAAFEEYLLGSDRMGLAMWLEKQNIGIEEIRPFIKYCPDCGDAVDAGSVNKLQVMECIKDAYGSPYIPGSSIKGMLRTVLLGADILKQPQKYQQAKTELRGNADKALGKVPRNRYLRGDSAEIEKINYRTLDRAGTKPHDAVNDSMQGLIVSDSAPVSVDKLVLCQKVELHTDGTETKLPLLRECIRPDTELRFTLTVDGSICSVTGESLMEAVKVFMQSYYENFMAAFPDVEAPKENYVLCGGGCGFVSKTIVYPMYGKNEGLDMTRRIFENTKVPKFHRHDRDRSYGASPHILKCTVYQGKRYQMGMCEIEKIKAMETL
ncbi:MAG: type III-A CRISPR-associated RAMP protein Csm5 [Roseburia sp.]|nr:type III-A CRISPR-associated RAMP protein Csm5 [Roseburia sp.]